MPNSRFKINYKLLPIKIHYFFFMAVGGSMLPFIPVLARSLGVSVAFLGFIMALLPILVLLAKPSFGALSDKFPKHRKKIFIFVIIIQALSLSSLGLIPQNEHHNTEYNVFTSTSFWIFLVLMCIGNVCFNVANSLSDAICFELLGPDEQFEYGKQRVWGSVGWGSAAFLSGALMTWWGSDNNSFDGLIPACTVTLLLGILDTITCLWLMLPEKHATESILKNLFNLAKHRRILLFLFFAAFVGLLDGFLIYYLLWYLEDLATNTVNIKLLEGLIVAAQTLGGELLFFPISGWILNKIGHTYCLSLVFSLYAVRLSLLSLVPTPWLIVPIELLLQGPTYALGYSTIVATASSVAPQGTEATVQGIAAGVDDSLGYCLGSLIGGQLYKNYGGRGAFQTMSLIALVCCLSHLTLNEILRIKKENNGRDTIVQHEMNNLTARESIVNDNL